MRHSRGYTLITTMMVMVVLFVIGAAGALLAYYGDMTSGAMTNFAKAYYNADYGIREAMYNANNYFCNCANDGCGFSQTMPTGGAIKVITNTDQAGRTCFIESIGTGQTGGYVAKVASVAGNVSNWGAAGMLNGISSNFFGSMSINGCDFQDECLAVGLVTSASNISNLTGLDLQTCSNIQNPNNPKGIMGSSYYKSTGATDVTPLITPFSSFDQPSSGEPSLVSYLQNQACPPDGSSCLTPPQQPSGNCYCNGNVTMDSSGNMTCNMISSYNMSQCTTHYYYATGTITASSGVSLNGETIYAGGGINISGPLTMTNSHIYAGSNSSITFGQGSTLQGSTVYVQSGSVSFGSGVDLCGGQPCTSSTDSIVYTDGNVYINSPIQGGLIYGNTVNMQLNGGENIGTTNEPTMTVANTLNISMKGNTSYYGLIMANSIGSGSSLGNSSINGAFYANNVTNLSIGGNASINFDYATLNQLYRSFQNILNPVYCYSGVSSINPLNIVTLY